MTAWVEWRPASAPHVLGEYERPEVDRETGQREPQHWKATCETCGDATQGTCDAGQPRRWIQQFAALHYHPRPNG